MVILSQATFWYGQNRLSGALLPLRPRQDCRAERKIERPRNCRFSGRFSAVFSPVLHEWISAISLHLRIILALVFFLPMSLHFLHDSIIMFTAIIYAFLT